MSCGSNLRPAHAEDCRPWVCSGNIVGDLIRIVSRNIAVSEIRGYPAHPGGGAQVQRNCCIEQGCVRFGGYWEAKSTIRYAYDDM